MKNILLLLWNSLKTNKTWICSLIFLALQQTFIAKHFNPEFLEFLKWFFGASGIVSLWLHIAPVSLGGSNALSPTVQLEKTPETKLPE